MGVFGLDNGVHLTLLVPGEVAEAKRTRGFIRDEMVEEQAADIEQESVEPDVAVQLHGAEGPLRQTEVTDFGHSQIRGANRVTQLVIEVFGAKEATQARLEDLVVWDVIT